MSVKSNYVHEFEKPFLWLARKLTGDPDLKFIQFPIPPPPTTLPIDSAMAIRDEEMMKVNVAYCY